MMISLSKYDKYLIYDPMIIGATAKPDAPVDVVAAFLHFNDMQEDGIPLVNMGNIPAETIAEARKRLAKTPGE